MTTTPLRLWRTERGMSIRELERLTGINRGRLSIIERGITPTPDQLARILAVIKEDKEG